MSGSERTNGGFRAFLRGSFTPTAGFFGISSQTTAWLKAVRKLPCIRRIYGKIHGCPPAESDMQQYFRVSPPSVHQMILTLETHGLIERTPGQSRSIRLLIAREELPDLI